MFSCKLQVNAMCPKLWLSSLNKKKYCKLKKIKLVYMFSCKLQVDAPETLDFKFRQIGSFVMGLLVLHVQLCKYGKFSYLYTVLCSPNAASLFCVVSLLL